MSDLAKIDVYFSVHGFQEEDVRGKTVVIIDVLRASSSMIQACLLYTSPSPRDPT